MFVPGTSIQQYVLYFDDVFYVIPVTLQVVMLIFETLRNHNKQVKKSVLILFKMPMYLVYVSTLWFRSS